MKKLRINRRLRLLLSECKFNFILGYELDIESPNEWVWVIREDWKKFNHGVIGDLPEHATVVSIEEFTKRLERIKFV